MPGHHAAPSAATGSDGSRRPRGVPVIDRLPGSRPEAPNDLETEQRSRRRRAGASPKAGPSATAGPHPFLGNKRESRPANSSNRSGPNAELEARRVRRQRRYALREVSWEHSSIRRGRMCGRVRARRAGGADQVPEIRAIEGDGCYWAGVARCGSVWACPVCSPKIRHERSLEVEAGMHAWLAAGNSIVFLTLTMPHDFGESCEALMDTIGKSFSAVFSGRPYKRDRDRFGIVHHFRAWDATHGDNGWHPHIHAALFIQGHLDQARLGELEDALFVRWAGSVTARGHRRPTKEHGIHLEEARQAHALAGYLLKVRGEETGASLAMELTRGDLKRGRGRAPFEILQGFKDTGDESDLELFHEWEKATKGKHFSRWSDGAREALRLDELEDQDLVEKEVGGITIYRPTPEEWHALTATPGGLCRALLIAERGGGQAVASYAAGLRKRWRGQRARAA